MKNFLTRLLAGVAIPAAITSSLFSTNVLSQKSSKAEFVERPYVVEIINSDGSTSAEVKGVSKEMDPFLISEAVGANPHKEDKFSAFPAPKMGIGGKITLYRAPDYKIKDGKKEIVVRSWTKTVGDLLEESKIELGQDDKINFSASTELELNMNININRVAKTTIIEPEDINYKVVKKSNPNLEKGTKNVLQIGKRGTKNKYFLVTREDGVEVSRVLQKSEIVTDPVDEIDEVGTKIVAYGSGEASWYVRTSQMIGACNILPKGTRIHVVNTANGKSIDITTSGGGIQTAGRIVDLSTGAFEALGVSTNQGTISNVRVEKYYPPE